MQLREPRGAAGAGAAGAGSAAAAGGAAATSAGAIDLWRRCWRCRWRRPAAAALRHRPLAAWQVLPAPRPQPAWPVRRLAAAAGGRFGWLGRFGGFRRLGGRRGGSRCDLGDAAFELRRVGPVLAPDSRQPPVRGPDRNRRRSGRCRRRSCSRRRRRARSCWWRRCRSLAGSIGFQAPPSITWTSTDAAPIGRLRLVEGIFQAGDLRELALAFLELADAVLQRGDDILAGDLERRDRVLERQHGQHFAHRHHAAVDRGAQAAAVGDRRS